MDRSSRFLSLNTDGLKIGILGGSFNPPHLGHLFISETAIKVLELDYVVWLVSPQNPLKEESKFLTYEMKLNECSKLTNNNKIIVSDFESTLPPPYFTYTTLSRIKERCPKAQLYWLMGADNMVQFPHWDNWEKIPTLASLVVFDRDEFMRTATQGIVAKKFKNGRIVEYTDTVRDKFDWVYIKIPKLNISSTQIREGTLD